MTPAIIEHPSPNHSPRKAGTRVDTVLLHHTASRNNVAPVVWMCNPKSEVSAHYVVLTDGDVLRLVPEERKAWHAGRGRLPWETCPPYDFNHRSIGIEVVNPGDGVTQFTAAQYEALAWLVPDIVKRLRLGWVGLVNGYRPGMPMPPMFLGAEGGQGTGYVLGHRDTAPGRKNDPDPRTFDWARVRQALAGGVA